MAKNHPQEIVSLGRQYIGGKPREINEKVRIGDAAGEVPATVAAEMVRNGAAKFVPMPEITADPAPSADVSERDVSERPAPPRRGR